MATLESRLGEARSGLGDRAPPAPLPPEGASLLARVEALEAALDTVMAAQVSSFRAGGILMSPQKRQILRHYCCRVAGWRRLKQPSTPSWLRRWGTKSVAHQKKVRGGVDLCLRIQVAEQRELDLLKS